MIFDQIQNAEFYTAISPRIKRALDYLRQTDFISLAPGKYEMDGGNLYALVQQYTTKTLERGAWESHRKYIDVQYVVDGVERMGYTNVGNLTVSQPYREADDFQLLKGEGNFLLMRSGSFVVLWPQDAHMPGMAVGEPAAVTKVVVKIAV